ncbi:MULTISPECIES: glycoside hydrolase family 16 protein [Actinomycetes]|uniref:glycoside hydrolase family 16 protein n=1 Tax=Actinomycetes TaxID=1760 RepID=UPI0006911F44|nr:MULTISPECIES: glycoside hydrolase family 16 protein [Actinomycetes]
MIRRLLVNASSLLVAVALTAAMLAWSAQASPASAATCTASAGTTAAPRGNITAWPGWRQIFVDDFNRCDLGSSWGKYSGQPGGNPHSWWDPSQVSVSDGKLRLGSTLQNGRWLTGGVSNHTVAQQYGKWEMRFRVDKSDEVSFHLLLWPKNEVWPPEIDFLESVDGTRATASAAVHYRNTNGSQGRVMQGVSGDFSRWNVVGVEWGPGIVRMTMNGKIWSEWSDGRVPATPMWLGVQLEAGACQRIAEWNLGTTCPRAGTPSNAAMEVDWVNVYAPGW